MTGQIFWLFVGAIFFGSYPFPVEVLADDLNYFTGTIDRVREQDLVIDDGTLTISENIVYFNSGDERVSELKLKRGDRVSFQANNKGVIFQIKPIKPGDTPLSKSVQTNGAEEKRPSPPSGELKFKGGVWTN